MTGSDSQPGPDEPSQRVSIVGWRNWGDHPLKQFSSLGAWMDYFHMSTGVTETTCHVPFKFGGLHGISIADMRPFSQEMWASQPQHDNVAGHTFLRYVEDGKMRDMEYMGTKRTCSGGRWAWTCSTKGRTSPPSQDDQAWTPGRQRVTGSGVRAPAAVRRRRSQPRARTRRATRRAWGNALGSASQSRARAVLRPQSSWTSLRNTARVDGFVL